MSKRPNILFISSDQQHWNTLGVDNPEIKTPALDRLAREGTLFDRAYCPNPTCTPTRASIITGLYPSQHGAYSLGTKLDEGIPTFGEALQAAGYDVSLIGKAHFQPLVSTERYPSLEAYPLLRDLDFWKRFRDPFYGFNHVELARNHSDEAHVGQHYALWMEEKGLSDWQRHFQNTWGPYDFSEGAGSRPGQYGRWSLPEDYHMNAWIADRTAARLDACAQADKPFMLWASFFDPHPPYLVPEPWDTCYDPATLSVPEGREGEHDHNPPHFAETQEERPDFSRYEEPGGHACHGFQSHRRPREKRARDLAIYYGMVSCMDKYIGRILDHLDRLGLAENTLVVFTSDHGHFMGQHGLIAKGPFHYEDVIRVPFIVRWPGTVPAGERSPALQSLVDLAPTFLAAASVDPVKPMAGVNQLPAWRGETPAVRTHAVVENRHQPTTIHLRTVIDDRYKITVYRGQDYGELFDLESDPGEFHNRWNDPDYQSIKATLLLTALQETMRGEVLPMPRIAPA